MGVSPAVERAVDQAASLARGDDPVVIAGPTGTGKTHLARAIHAWSARAGATLEVVAIAAMPPEQQARELFGCAAGVRPDQPVAQTGALERAAGGTLVIKALDAVAPGVRAALERALRERSFRREGEGTPVALSARVIATAGAGGQDLLAGVGAQVVELPALAERREDVLPLAAHFLALFAREEGVTPVGFTADARSSLEKEKWAGNVRELRERIRQAVRLAGDGAISAEALMLATDGDDIPSFKEAKRAFETRYVEGLLRRCSGNISRAARLAKKDRKDFYDVIRRTGVDPQAFRS